MTNNCAASIAPAATCTVTVTFNPATDGAVSGTLTLTDNTPTSPQIIALSGTGIEFSLGADAVGRDQADCDAGQTVTYQLRCSIDREDAVHRDPRLQRAFGDRLHRPSQRHGGRDKLRSVFSERNRAHCYDYSLARWQGDRDPKEPRNHHPRQPQVAFVYAGLIALLLWFSASRQRGVMTRAVFARTVLLVVFALTLVSCGGGAAYDPPPPPQSYSITVTAKAAGGSQSLMLTLTVQP